MSYGENGPIQNPYVSGGVLVVPVPVADLEKVLAGYAPGIDLEANAVAVRLNGAVMRARTLSAQRGRKRAD